MVTKTWKRTELTLESRNRLEYRFEDRVWLLRSRLQAEFPWSITRLQLTPYVSDEVFYVEGDGLSQNRFLVGIKSKFSEEATICVSYMLRHVDKVRFDILYLQCWIYF